MRAAVWLGAALLAGCVIAVRAQAQVPLDAERGVLELEFTPVRRAQLAIWVERGDGQFLGTVRLTEAVALRGIGNRPGASEMNSGFRWPYGRREGVLPIWATRRASAPGARLFRRVIYQDRMSEGLTARTSHDYSADDYYCLSFDRALSRFDALDAVSCASPFLSDKGRYLSDTDLAAGYAEPYEQPLTGRAFMRTLSQTSLYPPRRDVRPCSEPNEGCFQHADVASYAAHAREVMPDIDAVTMATPVGGALQRILFAWPSAWPPGPYRACLEVNVEGDYNATFNDLTHPSPVGPGNRGESWDAPFVDYGYPYRGQPSVLYCVDFAVGGGREQLSGTRVPAGSAGTWDVTDPAYGSVRSMDGVSDDPRLAPGSGADRLLAAPGADRVRVRVQPAVACLGDQVPSEVQDLAAERHPDRLHAHEWVRLRFGAASDDHGVVRYEIRYGNAPIIDEVSFARATPAKQASVEAAGLMVPTAAAAGELMVIDTGGLAQQGRYFIAVRAIDACAGQGPIRAVEIETPAREFMTVTPCFIATAAWGTPLAAELGSLRRLRDRQLAGNVPGRLLLAAYQAWGPRLARRLHGRERARALVRAALRPVVAVARWLDAAP